jgi:hypothetical protein
MVEDPGEEIRIGSDRPVADEGCVRQIAASYLNDAHARGARYLDALETAVRLAATVRGGAAVLAVSHGVALHPEQEFLTAYEAVFGPGQSWKLRDELTASDPHGPALDRLMRLAVERGVPVSFVDPSSTPSGIRSARRRDTVSPATNPIGAAYLAPARDLGRIAGTTGGAFLRGDDLGNALRAVYGREDGRYLVGFYADRDLDEDELRAVELSSRRDGVTVDAGLPYDVRARSRDGSVGTIVLEPPRPVGKDGERRLLSFKLHAPQVDLGYELVDDLMTADLSLHVRVLTADGRHVADQYDFFRHSYPPQTEAAGKRLVLAVRGWLEAEPGGYRIEATFRNPYTGHEVAIFHEMELTEARAGNGP